MVRHSEYLWVVLVALFSLHIDVYSFHTRPRFTNSAILYRHSSITSLSLQKEHDEDLFEPSITTNRRRVLQSSASLLTGLTTFASHAHAELVAFPLRKPLNNRYHFLRAGQSEMEGNDDVWVTNPLFLTNRENQMVLQKSERQLREACQAMRQADQLPTITFHSLAANGMDSADFIARELLLARDRLLPEFTYLDGRGVGLWEGTRYSTSRYAVWALDVESAGPQGMGGRPPANDDGTPNETLADQFVRLRQFLSLQESRTSGENILVIFPDGTGPALLSAMMAGIPLSNCHALEFEPGEIRLDISKESIIELYRQRKGDPEYLAALEKGRESLETLRATPQGFVNLKDQHVNEQQLAIDQEFAESQRLKRNRIQEQQEKEKGRLQAEKQQRIDTYQAQRDIQNEQKARAQEQAKRRQLDKEERLQESNDNSSPSLFSSPVDFIAPLAVGVSAVVAAVSVGKNGLEDAVANAYGTPAVIPPPADSTEPSSATDADLSPALSSAAIASSVANETTPSPREDAQESAETESSGAFFPLAANATLQIQQLNANQTRVGAHMAQSGSDMPTTMTPTSLPQAKEAPETDPGHGALSPMDYPDETKEQRADTEEELQSLEFIHDYFRESISQASQPKVGPVIPLSSRKMQYGSLDNATELLLDSFRDDQTAPLMETTNETFVSPGDLFDDDDAWLRMLVELRDEDE